MTAREMIKKYRESHETCDTMTECDNCVLDICVYNDAMSAEYIFDLVIKELEEKDEEIAVLKERIAIMMEDKE